MILSELYLEFILFQKYIDNTVGDCRVGSPQGKSEETRQAKSVR